VPIPRTRLIGREDELPAARVFLLEDAVPLLALTGPGGVGKTRLSLAIAQDVAAQFADGVLWVDLAPVTDPALVASTVVAALALPLATDQPIAREWEPNRTDAGQTSAPLLAPGRSGKDMGDRVSGGWRQRRDRGESDRSGEDVSEDPSPS
jgi:hypothetical protein